MDFRDPRPVKQGRQEPEGNPMWQDLEGLFAFSKIMPKGKEYFKLVKRGVRSKVNVKMVLRLASR